jgi:hypothetical protein
MKEVKTMGIVRIALCLNTEDPDQKELFDFVSYLPNGKKRNASAFLKTLVDREYQKKKQDQIKKAPIAPRVEEIKTNKGGIKYLASKDINKNANSGSSCSTD